MAKFDYNIKHIPGKLLYAADALSRAPTSVGNAESLQLQEEVEVLIVNVVSTLPASRTQLDVYCRGQAQDALCSCGFLG